MEMKKYKLGDLIEVTRGASLGGEFYSTIGKYIRLTLGNFDYINNVFKDNTSKDNIYYVGNISERFILKKGDIITPLTEQTIGLLGSVAKIPEDNKYIQSQDVALIKCKNNLLNYSFAYYLISCNSIKKQLSASAQQTKIRHTSPDKIKGCSVWIPQYVYQEKIASVLSVIDNKIALNKKINKELEVMAKELYDYWFVQFDFPNEEGKPYKTSGGKMVYNEVLKREIPEGWEVKKVKDILKVLTGKEDSNFATKNGPYKFFTCSSDIYNCDIFAFEGNAVLIAGNGDFNIKHFSGRFNAYQRTYVLIPEDVKYYAELFLVSSRLVASFRKGSQGSIVKFITKGDIENIKILLPKNELILYDLNQYLFLIEKNQTEIEKLTKLRDFLLPLLMNGQVEVKD